MDMRITGRIAARCALVSLLPVTTAFSSAEAPQSAGEARAMQAFAIAQKLGTPELYAFLKEMPKGAELHYHLSGGIYAETYLQDAIKQHLCIDAATARYAKPAPGATIPPTEPCPAGTISAAKAVEDQKLYDRLVDALSMRSFVPSDGFTGHDQFFSGNRTNGPSGWTGEWLAEVAERAADQNELYLEIMTTPDFRKWIALSSQVAWPANPGEAMDRDQFAKVRDELVGAGILNGIPDGRRQMDEAEAMQRKLENCESAKPDAACSIKMRYIFTIGRSQPPANVFAQALIGFALCAADPRFVGINIAAPEDGRVAMRDYHLHMQMLDYLHSLYPQVHLSLHAGELAPGLVPPEGLRFHIREAIELGHAERIGHGDDVFYEDDALGLLKEMAAKHIMVEINLTSNDVILGIKGRDHPLAGYRAMGVPVALNTDDEGNSRIDLTHEYVKGAEEQGLGYLDMKLMARTSFEHPFLPGASLWAQGDVFTHRVAACGAPIEAGDKPDAKCAAFLQTSEKAAEQWELERRFAVFEANPPVFRRER